MKKFVFILFLVFFAIPSTVLASIGVGVSTGKIQVTENLYPGTIYSLPNLTVINTGDEPSDYAVGISYMEKQPELKPDVKWFTFSPEKFHLDPGKAQVVTIKLSLPLNAVPGDYFTFVEGFPSKNDNSGGTTVGIAAAAKLYFTVKPANILSGIYYRGLSLYKLYSPWPQRAAIVLAVIVLYLLAKKYLNVQVGLKKENKEEEKKE